MVTLSMTQKSTVMEQEIILVFLPTVDRDKKWVFNRLNTQDIGRGFWLKNKSAFNGRDNELLSQIAWGRPRVTVFGSF